MDIFITYIAQLRIPEPWRINIEDGNKEKKLVRVKWDMTTEITHYFVAILADHSFSPFSCIENNHMEYLCSARLMEFDIS